MTDSGTNDQKAQRPAQLDEWLRFKLEQPDDASVDDIRRALMDQIESGEFATDDQFELATCLVSGRPHQKDSEEFAIEAQLRRRVDAFHKEFFELPPLDRRQRLFQLWNAADGFPALQMRLNHPEYALQVDASQLDRLSGRAEELATLILETYTLPQPEKVNTRRQRLQEIFATASSQPNENRAHRELANAAGQLVNRCPSVARLDMGLLRALGWTPEGFLEPRISSQRSTGSGHGTSQPQNWTNGSARFGLVLMSIIAVVVSVMLAQPTQYHSPPPIQSYPQNPPPGLVESLDEILNQRLRGEAETPAAVQQLLDDIQLHKLEQLTPEELERRFGDDPDTAKLKARLQRLMGPDGQQPIKSGILSLVVPLILASPQTDIDLASLPDNAVPVVLKTLPTDDGTGRHVTVVGVTPAARTAAPEVLDAVMRLIEKRFPESIHETHDVALNQQSIQLDVLLSYYIAKVKQGHIPRRDVVNIGIRFQAASAVMRARMLLRQGRHSQAQSVLETALGLTTDYPQLYQTRAAVHHTQGNFRQAVADLDRVIELEPQNSRAYYSRVTSKNSLGETERALADCTEAIHLFPQEADLRLLRGMLYVDIDRNAAMDDVQEAVRLAPYSPAAWTQLAGLHRQAGDTDAALRDLDKAERHGADYARLYRERSRVREQRKEFDAAIADLKEYIKRADEDVEDWCDLVSYHIEVKSFGEARAALYRAAELDPDWVRVNSLRGTLHEETGNLEAALKAWTRVVELAPENPWSWSQRADVLVELNRLDEALDDREQALGLAPTSGQYLRLHGVILEKRREYEFAIEDWSEFIRLFPDDSYGYRRRSICHNRLKNWEQSVQDARRAISRGDHSAFTYNLSAWANHKLGRLEEAIRDSSQGIRRHPDDAYTLNTRSLAYAQQGDFEPALADITAALRVEPQGGVHFFVRGCIYEGQRDYRSAVDDYDLAIRFSPDLSDAIARRAFLLATCPDERIRDVSRARSEAERSLTLDRVEWSRAFGHDALAAACAAQGDFEAAVEHIQRALDVASGIDDRDAILERQKLYESRQAFVAPTAAD